jgi:cytochrome c
VKRREALRTRILLLSLLVLSVAFTSGCERYSTEGDYKLASRITGGGDPARGKEMIRHYGCQACHSIPDVHDAVGTVGPPLDHLSKRVYLAGELPNTTENLMHWIQHPHDIHPNTAMPEMGVSDQDARDIAAYLYTLK